MMCYHKHSMYGSVCSKDGHQHLEAASSTTSNMTNDPAGAMQGAGVHAIPCTATKIPTAFWWSGEILFRFPSLHHHSDHP